tara:strand:+ start:337 stop:1080 length:744 start_codon:yes stop_codon:yes gene_type:complete
MTNSFTIEENIKVLKEHGVVVIENAIDKEDALNYRNLILDYFDGGKNRCAGYKDGSQTIRPDGINVEHFKNFTNLLDNEKLMGVLNGVTNNKLRWVHHFDIHLNFAGAKGWHSDAQMHHIKDKNLPLAFNNDDYKVYRVAIYLQDHTNDGGGLFVRPGSHINPSITDDYYIGTEVGDIVLFDARIRHMGGHYSGDRCTIYAAMGADNDWSKLHAQGAIDRQTKQNNQKEYVMKDYLTQKLNKLGIKY